MRREYKRAKQIIHRDIDDQFLAEEQMYQALTPEEKSEEEWERRYREDQAWFDLHLEDGV